MDFCFLVKQEYFQLLSEFLRTGRALIFLDFLSFSSQSPLQSPQPAFLKLTFLYSQWIRNLNALACLPKNAYLCIGNGQKGSISRMSDECLITLETVFPYCYDCQAVMRKFTLAGKSLFEPLFYNLFYFGLYLLLRDIYQVLFATNHNLFLNHLRNELPRGIRQDEPHRITS